MTRRIDCDLVFVSNKTALPVEPPTRMLLVPWGNVHSSAGDFVIDQAAAESIVNAFASRGIELVTDKEHETLGGDYASPDGSAPAMAWIKSLSITPNVGIFGEGVEWTPKGAEFIRNKEYRYLSPVVMKEKKGGKVVAMHSVALTNTPAISGMPAIVNKETTVESEKFDNVRYWLNLPATATNEEIIMELETYLNQLRAMVGADAKASGTVVAASLKAKLDELVGLKASRLAVCKALAVAETAKDDDIVLAINAAKKPVDSSAAEIAALTRRVEKAEGEAKSASDSLAQIKADERIQQACSQGKLTNADLIHPQDGPFYKKLAHDERAWSAFFDRLPAKAPKDGVVVGNKGGAAPAGGGDRVAVINKAKSEWKDEDFLQRATKLETFVCSELAAAKLPHALSDKDKELIAS